MLVPLGLTTGVLAVLLCCCIVLYDAVHKLVTISPVLAGRDKEPRLGMVAGVELLPGHGRWTKLLSARRHGDFVFLRYGLKTV